MIRDDAKIIVTQTGVSLKEALTKEVVKALDKEASIYMNYEIPEVKLGYKNLMVGSHFTMTEDKKKSTRLATNEERLMLFEEMFKYGITFDKHEHRLIGKLVGV